MRPLFFLYCRGQDYFLRINFRTSPVLRVILFESRYSRKGRAYFLDVLSMSLNSAIVNSAFFEKKVCSKDIMPSYDAAER